ncbi:MAG: aminotransferase class I/II-fold pyridoxal phosphate-dependent enzyme [Patescibacteria group bacterium]
MRIPYALAVYGKNEIKAVNDVLKEHRKFASWTKTREFEKKIAKLFGKKYGIMVNSGSSANLLAFELLDLPKGSEVITPVLTFSTTISPILKKGLVPVFVDVEKGSYLIDEDKIEKLITPKTKALMIPSLIGNIPNLKQLRKIADKYKLYLIEDSCDTLGAKFDRRPTGKYSDISTTSFYGSHIITAAGGGGMICVNRPEWHKRALVLRGWGRSSALFSESEDLNKRFSEKINGIPYDGKFIFGEAGYNFQPIEIQAAFGLEQLKRLKTFSATRARSFKALNKFFEKYDKYFILPKSTKGADTNWLAFPLTIKENAPFSRMEIVKYLEKNDIQTRPIFTGNILRQPGFKKIAKTQNKYPVADYVMANSFLIGCHHGMEKKHIQYLKEKFNSFLDKK